MDYRIDLQLLRAFVAVAEERNFARGAKRLATSQSAVSVRIKRLEDILGARILERDRQGTNLTPIGEQLLDEAKHLLDQSDRLVDRIRAAASGQGEKIRIASTQRAMSAVTPKLISYLRSEFPKVDFTLLAHSSPEQLDALRAGKIDIGILQPPANGFQQMTGISSAPLVSEPLVVAMPRKDPLTKKLTLDWRDLRGRVFTLAPIQKNEPLFLEGLTERCGAAGFAPEINPQDIGFRAIMPYLAAHEGVALVPASATLSGEIETRPIDNPLQIEFEMIWNDDFRKPLIPRISSLVEGSGIFA